jgi:predicted DNA-binding ribbon-helix-helix protein
MMIEPKAARQPAGKSLVMIKSCGVKIQFISIESKFMSHAIELPDEVYNSLEAAARAVNMTPAQWIAAHLHGRQKQNEERPLAEMLRGLIGAIDSTKEQKKSEALSAFGRGLSRKFEKQGLKLPS